jgi:hypothetical protein
MRAILCILLFIAVESCAPRVMVYLNWNLQDNPVASRIAIGYCLFICAGLYWMLYDCWQHGKQFTRRMWLFLSPGGFLWYYFERFRPLQLRKWQEPYS